ncbi:MULTISPECIES: hypothetical protein [Clostridium]|uniref:Uncharacterized protein n=1 Tax=Clostridium lapidicellarium TaxID=3240931 RepID=A0ABV4DVS0_9CLOT|nr:hypothetical protein [uncultured Clostridium sp.]
MMHAVHVRLSNFLSYSMVACPSGQFYYDALHVHPSNSLFMMQCMPPASSPSIKDKLCPGSSLSL